MQAISNNVMGATFIGQLICKPCSTVLQPDIKLNSGRTPRSISRSRGQVFGSGNEVGT
jgi:hypothetical protein